ncbi:right-handed parallel beta-helix repeat-containing protein [Algibacillus agarilyticus]|uniref:right-handed parallel beta-helix repeat-containing protein n=1 Tax=Algibacillus agarilyticus TaxID=2234133 RepID=UPI000DCF9D4F|nr:right-handed parallel beta-helix repeat-containing protein [Algibacillus agarilyticus]
MNLHTKSTFKLSCLLSACILPFSHFAWADTLEVNNATQLQNALKNAAPGDEILLLGGSYLGDKATSGSTKAHFFSSKSGTASNPITVRSKYKSQKQTIKGSSVDSGYLFYLTGDHWVIKDLKFTKAQKGIMLEGANNNTIDNVELWNIGAEAVHMRYYSSNNILSNCYIHDTGKRTGQEGFGEGVYIGTHDGHTAEKLDKSDNNRIGGCSIGPNVTAEAFDIKAGVKGTIIESNYINGSGIIGTSGSPAADSFIDLKGTDNIIRNNRMDWNNDSNIDHAIFTYQEHRSSNIYDNEFTLSSSSPTYKLLEETVHDANNVRLDGGTKIVQADYQLRKIDDAMDSSIEKPAYTYPCYDELTNGCGTVPNDTDTSEPDDTDTTEPDDGDDTTESPTTPPITGNCAGTETVNWNSKTEISIANTNCISFPNDLANETLQAWDSDANSSCNFRGLIESTDGAVSVSVTANYHSFSNLSGKTFKLIPSNNCQYIKVRAY